MSVLIKAILFNNFIIFGLTVNLIYAQTSSLPYGTVLRTGAGSFYPVVKIIEKPESMTILRKQEGWVEIKLDTGKSGWISENATSAEISVFLLSSSIAACRCTTCATS